MRFKGDQIDDMIREALTKEEAEMFDQMFDEPSIFELVTSMFRGRFRYLAVLTIFIGIVVLAIGIYCFLEFLAADDVPSMLRWGLFMLGCFGIVTMMKIWHWMEMQRYALTREIKRLELQVANLAAGRSIVASE